MTRQSLDGLTREELVERAERLGVARPRVLTQAELIDEILGRTTTGRERTRARGWLGRARDVVAGVIERGLHLPEVAKALRSTPAEKRWPEPPPPLPTITLAEIYAAQGHLDRAVTVLDDVLAREPAHSDARALRERLQSQSAGGRRAASSTRAPAAARRRRARRARAPPRPRSRCARTRRHRPPSSSRPRRPVSRRCRSATTWTRWWPSPSIRPRSMSTGRCAR
ncbi:MAG: tetratricopeptide repeat protein [Polyangiaceae bacterium]